MYGKCGSLSDAKNLFDDMPDRTIFTWNAMVGAYVSNGEPSGALELYREMWLSDISVDACTFPSVLKACGVMKDLNYGAEIHALLRSDRDLDVIEINALVIMYSRCGRTDEALRVFHEMDEKDNISWNSMLSAFVQNDLYKEAVTFFHEMLEAGHKPDLVTIVGNTLIDMYAKCCCVHYMTQVYDRMPNKDLISWTSMIAGGMKYISSVKQIHANILRLNLFDHVLENTIVDVYENEALEVFYKMGEAGVKPDLVALLSILSASASLSASGKGKEIPGFLIRKGFPMDGSVASSLVDMYARCGNIENSFKARRP
ncbi:hypothetical protein MKX01_009870 [Papaver californicum]|nr:hypothetical protein MKX01_009870 [Papaver californicum]